MREKQKKKIKNFVHLIQRVKKKESILIFVSIFITQIQIYWTIMQFVKCYYACQHKSASIVMVNSKRTKKKQKKTK